MTLWLRRTGLASPADADRADYLVIEHDKVIGRIYEDRHTPAEYRWFWSITEHVDPALGITTNAPHRRRDAGRRGEILQRLSGDDIEAAAQPFRKHSRKRRRMKRAPD